MDKNTVDLLKLVRTLQVTLDAVLFGQEAVREDVHNIIVQQWQEGVVPDDYADEVTKIMEGLNKWDS